MKDIVAVTAILLIVCVGALFVRLDKIDSEDGFDWLNHNIRSEECATDIVSGEIYDMNSTDTFNLSDYIIRGWLCQKWVRHWIALVFMRN